MSKRTLIPAVGLLVVLGCSSLVMDPSPKAVASGDMTLIGSCQAVPSRGLDACRVKDGTTIDSVWRIIVPAKGRQILGGELNVKMRDITRTYAINDTVIEVPLKEVVGESSWKKEDSGFAIATAKIRFRDNQGLEQVVQARGVALILVLDKGYDEMPLDSGYTAWGTTCRVGYSTAGRSALQCQ